MWSAWNRFLSRVPSWLGIQIASLITASVLSLYIGLRAAGSLGWSLAFVWVLLFVAMDVAMLVAWSWKGYSLSAPPVDGDGRRIMRGDVRHG